MSNKFCSSTRNFWVLQSIRFHNIFYIEKEKKSKVQLDRSLQEIGPVL